MRVDRIRTESAERSVILRADVHFDTHWVWGDEPFRLWYRYPAEFAPRVSAANGDPFVAALLGVAMRLGEDLHIDAEVSPRLHRHAAGTIQDIWTRWHADFRRVRLDCGVGEPRRPGREPRRGLFFSLGVDSAYCLAKNRRGGPGAEDRIDDLVMIEGFDVYLWESERFPPMVAAAERVAAAMGARIVPVTTNLREVTDRVVDWVTMHFAAGLASTVLGLGAYDAVHLAASFTYDHLFPGGSHPLLDPLWGTEALTIVHDGCEADRMDKIRLLADPAHQVLLDHLRVCNTGELTDAYNCGRCEKCVRTMIALRAVRALDRCASLPSTIDVERFAGFPLRPEYHLIAYRELLGALGDDELDRRLRGVLEDKLRVCAEAGTAIGLQVAGP
ncbi:hypothetical protein [Couchioplanes azureus]|uniref:hypothetical protein n=1 Tax=Couchioplanes caeruleus TaxID=56438 RepID=UPI001671790D|nr:hypothetical protein [Couchioplanes caeruleus]GGQ75417.1 hypothetical protein GCM10010166_51790 [Couchioplanes caeruleus subsp. azureus]